MKQWHKRYGMLMAIATSVGCINVTGSSALASASAANPSIQVTTQPPIAQAIPFKEAVQLRLKVLDAQGQSVKNAKIRLQIRTPSPTPWFTTDFPIVEGTTLLNLETVSQDGTLSLQQVFPIRGTYQLLISATPVTGHAFLPVQRTLTLTVPENPTKYFNLGILVVVLLGMGWGGGRIIGRSYPRQQGEIAPQPVRLLLSGVAGVALVSLLAINISAESIESHSHAHAEGHSHAHAEGHTHAGHHHSKAPAATASSLKLKGDQTATVGQLATLSVSATQKGQPLKNATFNIKTVQLEDNETTFATQVSGNAMGQLQWQQQFFDGAPHRVDVSLVSPGSSTPQSQVGPTSHQVEVEGVAPPLSTRLLSLAYFTAVLGVGFGVGVWQSRAKQSAFSLKP